MSEQLEIQVEQRYQYFPPMAADDRRQLKESIAKNGVLHPIVVDEHGCILDGHHRAAICAELGIAPPYVVRLADPVTEAPMSEEAKDDFIWDTNLARRHLTLEQKRDLIRHRLQSRPQASNRAIARDLHVSDKTVGAVRQEMEETAEIPRFDRPGGRGHTEGRRVVAAEERIAYDDPGGDTADHLATVYVDVTIRYLRLSTETRMRGSLPYPRESKRAERRIINLPHPAGVLTSGRDGYKQLATGLAQAIYRDLCERPIAGAAGAGSTDVAAA